MTIQILKAMDTTALLLYFMKLISFSTSDIYQRRTGWVFRVVEYIAMRRHESMISQKCFVVVLFLSRMHFNIYFDP